MSLNPKYVREKWIITLENGVFVLTDNHGSIVPTGILTPRQLAKIAWDKGAQEIVFDFDLNLDPDK